MAGIWGRTHRSMRDRRAVRATSKARAGPRGSVRPRAYAQIHAAQPRAGDRAPMGSGKRAVLIEKGSYFGVSLEMGCWKVVVLIKWGSYFGVSLEMGCRKVAVLIVLGNALCEISRFDCPWKCIV